MLYGALVVTLRTCYGALQIVVLLLFHNVSEINGKFCRKSLFSPPRAFNTAAEGVSPGIW